MKEIQEIRTLDVIEMEIRVLQDQAQRVVLGYAIETGRRLEEAKAMVGHGNWEDWVKKMGYSQSTANNLMRVFREYGASQQSLFGGETNSQALGNLSYTKALQLLALPDQEEREKFVAEHDVEAMSTRDLEKALRERDEALRRVKAAEANASAAEEARAKMEADMKLANASMESQKENADKYRRAADRLKAELKELKDKPVDVAVEKPSPEELEKLTAQAVERARAEDAERLAAMEKQLAAADGDVAAFRVHYEAWQEHFNKMSGYLTKISGRDPERAGKLRMAMKAVVERMAEW